MEEKIEYGNVTMIQNNLENLARELEDILEKNNRDMEHITEEEYYNSPAAKEILAKYKKNSAKFSRYPEEIRNYASILKLKIESYQHRTEKAKEYIIESTTQFLNQLK